MRKFALYPSLMAGGSGVEWYFGYDRPHSDLTCQDWRTRDQFWDIARYSIEVLRELPLAEMHPRNHLLNVTTDFAYCLARHHQSRRVGRKIAVESPLVR